jgi:type IV pilus assembly protein PilW
MRLQQHVRQVGVSLIELMVALAIGSLLVLGLVEVFAASRTAYQLSEGMARVQENARFAVDYLQRDLRMAGHMGCVNDQARFQTVPAGYRTLLGTPPLDSPLRFDMPIQAYNANGTAPGATVNLAAPPAGWSPALPAHITALGPLPGSDIVALRYFSQDGVPVTNIAPGATATISFDPARADVLRRGGVTNPGLFGIADCINATVFQARGGTDLNAGTIVAGLGGLNADSFLLERYLQGQAMVYRAESVVYYVATGAGGEPALHRARFTTTPGAAGLAPAAVEELVEGVESLQMLYGQDRQTNATLPPSGYIDHFGIATIGGGGLTAVGGVDETWRRVGMVKIGLLLTSPNPAAAGGPIAANPLRTLGVSYTVPVGDPSYRAVYESSVAVRNRLYGN